jgi:ribose transport system permease protein
MVAAQSELAPALLRTASQAIRTRALYWLVDYGVFAALLGLVAFFSVKITGFLQWSTFTTIGVSASEVGFLAAFFTVALIGGQIDLSVGTLTGVLGSVWAVTVVKDGHPLWLGFVVIIGVAVVVGLANGTFVVNVGVNSVVLTFASAQVLFGLGQWFHTRHQNFDQGLMIPIDPRSESFQIVTLVNGSWFGVPVPLFVLLVVYALLYVLLTHSKVGWHLYALGANPDAARRAGINVNRAYRLLFVGTALSTVLAMVVFVGRSGSVSPGHGFGNELDVMTAVLIGGASITGGRGRIERTLAGVALVYVLQYGLQTLQVGPSTSKMIRAGVFILAVALGAVVAKRRAG